MPQRHSKNNNDLAHFTYEEKRRLGFGTQKERLGKDSIKPFDSCALCLKPVIDPVCCKKGHLFCKDCIYACLLAQKKDIKRKVALYHFQEKQEAEEKKDQEIADRERELEAFDRQNSSAVPMTNDGRQLSRSHSSGFHGANSVKTTAYEEEALRTMRAYWLPSATPEASEKLEAPDTATVCPEGKEKLKLKDIFDVHFTDLPGREAKVIEIGGDRFMCASCSETFTNVSSIAAIRTCGHAFCKKCAEKFVVTDLACVTCSKPCKAKDVVNLAKGGTGFSAHGDQVVATVFKHLGSGSGAAPLRPITRL